MSIDPGAARRRYRAARQAHPVPREAAGLRATGGHGPRWPPGPAAQAPAGTRVARDAVQRRGPLLLPEGWMLGGAPLPSPAPPAVVLPQVPPRACQPASRSCVRRASRRRPCGHSDRAAPRREARRQTRRPLERRGRGEVTAAAVLLEAAGRRAQDAAVRAAAPAWPRPGAGRGDGADPASPPPTHTSPHLATRFSARRASAAPCLHRPALPGPEHSAWRRMDWAPRRRGRRGRHGQAKDGTLPIRFGPLPHRDPLIVVSLAWPKAAAGNHRPA